MALQLKGTSEVDAVKYSSTAEILVSAELIAASVNIKKGKVDESTGIDFVAVIDVSGSMAGSPINLVKESMKFVVETLKAEDQFSIVSFGATAKVELPLSKMTATGKQEALQIIQNIKIDTFTNLSAGLTLGIDQLVKRSFKNHTASILLFTDGEANRGIIDSTQVVNDMKKGLSSVTGTVSVHTFGFSADHNATFLTAISDAAAGMYYYVTESKKIPVLFAECLGGLLSTVAKDIKLEVVPAKGIKLHQILTRYTVTESDGKWLVDIGDIYAEEQRNIPIKVTVPSLASASTTPSVVVSCSISYFDLRAKTNSTDSIDIAILRPQEEVKEDESARAKAIQVDEQRNRVTAASALESAAHLGVSGKLVQAKQAIQDAIHSMEVSKSRNTSYTTSLVSDLKEALTRMDTSSDFNHMAAKYLYSMSRSHYNQRSSGVSLSGASAYLTSTKKEFMGIEDKKDTRSTGKPTLESSRKDKAVVSKETIAKSIRRLMLDLKEIQSYPLETVTAHPLESDIFEWHCNMRGPMGSPYANTIFHLVFLFPQNYPVQPPKLFNCTFIEHEHVYGTWVCLDLLEEAQWSGSESNKPYTGWTSAYSVQSILLQLQSFLFDKASVDVKSVEKAEKSSQQFHCEQCGHSSKKVWPEFPVVEKKQEKEYKEIDVKKERVVYLFDDVKEGKKEESIVNGVTKKEEKKKSPVAASEKEEEEVKKEEIKQVPAEVKKEETSKKQEAPKKEEAPKQAESKKQDAKQDIPKEQKKQEAPKKQQQQQQEAPKKEEAPKQPEPKKQDAVVQDTTSPVTTTPVVTAPKTVAAPPKTAIAPPKPQEVTLKNAPATVKLVANSQWKAVPSTLWNAPPPVTAPVKRSAPVEKKPQVEAKPVQVENKVEKKEEKKEQKPKVEDKKKKTKKEKSKEAEKIVVQLKPNQSLWAKPPAALKEAPKSKEVAPKEAPKQSPKPASLPQQQPKTEEKKEEEEVKKVAEKKEEVKKVEEKKKKTSSTPIVPIKVEVKGAWAARANAVAVTATFPKQEEKKEIVVEKKQEEVKPVEEEKKQETKPVVEPVVLQVEKKPQVENTKKQEEKPVKPVEKQVKPVLLQVEKTKVKPLSLLLSQLPNNTFSFFSFLRDDIILHILHFLSIRDLAMLSMVCKDFLRMSCDPSLWSNLFTQYYPTAQIASRSIQAWKHIFATERNMIKQSLVCFHTKSNFKDTVLGIPISYSVNPRTGNIDKITSTLDLLSYEAFYEENVRKSVWKVPFTHWLPLYLTHNHGERALPLIQKTLASLLNKSKFKPEMALDVIPKLMNTMVVNLMSGDVHASIAALEGYCAFHRLLLFFVTKYPELQDTVNEKAVSFVRNEENRHKEVMPSLGEFLPLLTVSNKVTWKEACMPYLYENFDRNALWTLKKYPGLATLESDAVSWDRLNKTFDATQVSIRLLMFHVYFFNKVARPENVSLESVANNYDAFYGRPSSQMKEALQKKCKEILGIKGWQEFFQGIGMVAPTPQYLTKWLRESVKNSLRKGYHSKNMR